MPAPSWPSSCIAAQLGELLLAPLGATGTGDRHVARAQPVEAGQALHEHRFAEPDGLVTAVSLALAMSTETSSRTVTTVSPMP